MAGGDSLTRLRTALASDLPPAPFVGAGFSVAVTGSMAEASWTGLLKDGIRECERVVSSLPPGWAGRVDRRWTPFPGPGAGVIIVDMI